MKKLLMLVALSSLLGACAQEENEEVAATAVDTAVAAPVSFVRLTKANRQTICAGWLGINSSRRLMRAWRLIPTRPIGFG